MSLCVCLECKKEYFSAYWDDDVEHIRKCKEARVDIRRPGALGACDAHGHEWYCFSCPGKGGYGDHRSFDCSTSMLMHLYTSHGIVSPWQSRLYQEELDRMRGDRD